MGAQTREIGAAIAREFAAFAGTGGLYARHLGTGETIRFAAEAEVPTASTIKLPILIELFRRAESGGIDLEQTVPVTERVRVGGSGILRDLSLGVGLSLRDHATLMIVVSDNTATNVLIDLLGVEAVNRTMADFGFPRTRLARRIDFDELDEARRFAVTTPAELAEIMAALAEDRILAAASRAEILGILRRQQERHLIPRYLPFDRFAADLDRPDNGLRIANKTGGWTGMRADVALVEWPGVRYVVAVVVEGDPDARFWPENEGDKLVGRLSRLVFDHFGGAAIGDPWRAPGRDGAAAASG